MKNSPGRCGGGDWAPAGRGSERWSASEGKAFPFKKNEIAIDNCPPISLYLVHKCIIFGVFFRLYARGGDDEEKEYSAGR